MITLKEALNYLKLERKDLPRAELTEIEGLIASAETYLKNAVGFVHDDHKALAKLFCRMVIADWYDNRGTVGRINDGARGILTQLANCPPSKEDNI